MRAEYWAVATAICWAVGSFFEKSGVKMGGFAPVMGTAIRTIFSLIFLMILSFNYWPQLRTASIKSIIYIAIGGGVIAGGLGIVSLYSALKNGQLSIVMTIAFCLTPVIGSIIGFVFLKEKLSPLQILGIVMCISGAAMVVLYKN